MNARPAPQPPGTPRRRAVALLREQKAAVTEQRLLEERFEPFPRAVINAARALHRRGTPCRVIAEFFCVPVEQVRAWFDAAA